MNTSSDRMGSGGLALIGVALGLVVAVIVDRELMEGQTDRPVVVAAVTAGVALLWLVVVRLFIWPTPARAAVRKQKGA
jgi:hypothetical protein